MNKDVKQFLVIGFVATGVAATLDNAGVFGNKKSAAFLTTAHAIFGVLAGLAGVAVTKYAV
jgi:hypothetical protein